MALVARNGLWLTKALPAGGDAQLLPRTSGMIEAVATGQLRLASLASVVSVDAGGQTGVLTIGSNAVVVQANLDVRGAINALQTNDLFVRDRLICVANLDGTLSTDAASVDITDTAGLLVGSCNTDGARSEVSLRWHKQPPASSNGRQMQANWELIGGSLKLSRAMPDGNLVSYVFDINDAGELEVSRRTAPFGAADSDAMYQRVAAWGRPATGAAPMSTGIVLPTSLNVY